MFDRTESEVLAQSVTIWVDQRTANMLNEFTFVVSGWNTFNNDDRKEYHTLCDRMLVAGVPNRHIKPIKGFMNSLSWAYGPEYEL